MDDTLVVIEGTLNPDGTLVLDEKPRVRPGRVRVRVEAVLTRAVTSSGELTELLREIRAERAAGSGGEGTADETVAAIRRMRDEADERLQRLDEARSPRKSGAC